MGGKVRLAGRSSGRRGRAAWARSVAVARGVDGATGNVPTENDEQEQLISWLDSTPCSALQSKLPSVMLGLFVFAIPNGQQLAGSSKQRAIYMAAMKRRGLRPGVFDLFLALPRGKWHGMFVEMKRTKGGRTSEEQLDFQRRMTQAGYLCTISKGFLEAQSEIRSYLRL